MTTMSRDASMVLMPFLSLTYLCVFIDCRLAFRVREREGIVLRCHELDRVGVAAREASETACNALVRAGRARCADSENRVRCFVRCYRRSCPRKFRPLIPVSVGDVVGNERDITCSGVPYGDSGTCRVRECEIIRRERAFPGIGLHE